MRVNSQVLQNGSQHGSIGYAADAAIAPRNQQTPKVISAVYIGTSKLYQYAAGPAGGASITGDFPTAGALTLGSSALKFLQGPHMISFHVWVGDGRTCPIEGHQNAPNP